MVEHFTKYGCDEDDEEEDQDEEQKSMEESNMDKDEEIMTEIFSDDKPKVHRDEIFK